MGRAASPVFRAMPLNGATKLGRSLHSWRETAATCAAVAREVNDFASSLERDAAKLQMRGNATFAAEVLAMADRAKDAGRQLADAANVAAGRASES